MVTEPLRNPALGRGDGGAWAFGSVRGMFSRLNGTARIWLLNGAIAATALALYTTKVVELDGVRSRIAIPWWALALMFAVAEVYVVHLQFRRDAHSLSLSEIPLVLGLFFASPQELVIAQLFGAAVALTVYRRQSPLKLVFNISHFCLEASLAAVIFHTIVGGASPLGPAGWIATFAATLVVTIVGVVMIILAISLSESRVDTASLPQALLFGVTVTVANTGLALISAITLWRAPNTAWLLFVPTAMLFLTYRLYAAEREKHDSLEALYASTRTLQQSLKVEAAVMNLLGQAREMFRADVAEIILFPDGDEKAVRSTIGGDRGFEVMKPIDLDPTEGVWARVAAEGAPVLIARPIENERLRSYFSSRGIRDAMVAPLQSERVLGIMMVANRLGDVSTFDSEDLRLFETLVNHAGVSLDNARLVTRLEESLAHLTEMNHLKDDFVAAVSHELRTPLTSIQGYIKTLLRPGVAWGDEERHDFLTSADRQGDRLRNLIEDLLAVSRLESSADQPELSPVDVPDTIRQTVEDLRERVKDHVIELQFQPDLPLVETDEGRVQQIVTNLIENACKYSPSETHVTVAARAHRGRLIVSVRDEGAGIPRHLHEKIFERFFQVDQSSTRAAGGTGLGLYICRKLAAGLGGELWLEDSDGTGSCFCLSIPIRVPSFNGPIVERETVLAL